MSRKPEVAELERYLNAAQKANCDLEERAETAEAELKEWQVLRAWGGTPEIVEQWIKGQQVRIHHAQDIEESLAKAEARAAELEAQNAKLRAALEGIASGRCSGYVLSSYPPKDPAVEAAKAALAGTEGRNEHAD